MPDENPSREEERFAWWSGYTPAKPGPNGKLVPLDADELLAEAARFRRGADRAMEAGYVAKARGLLRAAEDLQRRADAST